MNDEKRILEMIEAGTITAAEGMELLEAMKATNPDKLNEAVEVVPNTKSKKTYNFLKIRVLTDAGETKVNVNVPLRLVKSLGGLAGNIQNYLPQEAKSAMEDKGINLKDFDIDELLSALENGAIDGPLVDLDVDESGEQTKVLIYVE